MKDRDVVVVDVETQYLSNEIGGWKNLDKMLVGCAVTYSFLTDDYEVYSYAGINDLRERLLAADEVVGFNLWRFDAPVIFEMKLDDWFKSDIFKKLEHKQNDLLRRIWISKGLDPSTFGGAHKGLSLATISEATLGCSKDTSLGAEAPNLLREGHIDLLHSYCIRDVKLTRDLYTFIDKYGYVIDGSDTVIRIWAEANEKV